MSWRGVSIGVVVLVALVSAALAQDVTPGQLLIQRHQKYFLEVKKILVSVYSIFTLKFGRSTHEHVVFRSDLPSIVKCKS